jgi:hypothetical protein
MHVFGFSIHPLHSNNIVFNHFIKSLPLVPLVVQLFMNCTTIMDLYYSHLSYDCFYSHILASEGAMYLIRIMYPLSGSKLGS